MAARSESARNTAGSSVCLRAFHVQRQVVLATIRTGNFCSVCSIVARAWTLPLLTSRLPLPLKNYSMGQCLQLSHVVW